MTLKVGIVAYGAIVPTLARLCARNDTVMTCWQPPGQPEHRLPKGVKRQELEQVAEAPMLLFCAQASHARETARHLGEFVTASHVIVHVSRELEPQTHVALSTILREETVTHRIGFLSGPFRAEDVKHDRSASATLFSRFDEVHALLQEALVSPAFRLYRSRDLDGAQLAAAYTRVVAFVYGVALGMKQGVGVGATLFARGLAEVGRVVASSGGEERTVFGMSGAGNLFADVQQPYSVAVRLGIRSVEIGRFDGPLLASEFGKEAEYFVSTVRTMRETCAARRVSSHICDAALAMVNGELSTVEAAGRLMGLPALDE